MRACSVRSSWFERGTIWSFQKRESAPTQAAPASTGVMRRRIRKPPIVIAVISSSDARRVNTRSTAIRTAIGSGPTPLPSASHPMFPMVGASLSIAAKRCSLNLAKPKSSTLTIPSRRTMTFSGLMSR